MVTRVLVDCFIVAEDNCCSIIGIPNMWSLYRRDMINSVAILSDTNSNPNVNDSTVVYLFEYYMIGALLQYIRMLVCDRQVACLFA